MLNNTFTNCLMPLIFAGYFFYSTPFPFNYEEIKNTLTYVNKNVNENDAFYINDLAKPVLNYYLATDRFKTLNQLLNDKPSRINKQINVDDFKITSESIWLIFWRIRMDDDRFVIRRLDSLNYKRIKSFETNGSSAYFYQLK